MAASKNILTFDCETHNTDYSKTPILGITYSPNFEAPIWLSYGRDNEDEFDYLLHECFRTRKFLIGHNIKFDLVCLAKNFPLFREFICRWLRNPENVLIDTMVAEYLLHIDRKNNLEDTYFRYTRKKKQKLIEIYNSLNPTKVNRKKLPNKYNWWEDSYNDKKELVARGIKGQQLKEYAEADVNATNVIWDYQNKQFAKLPHLEDWFYDVEMELLKVLILTEIEGVNIDLNRLMELDTQWGKDLVALDIKLRQLAGKSDLNVNSTQQLEPILKRKLGFQFSKGKKGKSGVLKADKKTLEPYASKCYFVKLLMEYKALKKFKSSFTETFIERHEDGVIHSEYNQTITDTRRLSSSNPNGQNIPVRSKIGKQIREVYTPQKGYKFLCADFSQLEPRILAHLSGDQKLVNTFNAGGDVYNNLVESLKSQAEKYGVAFDRDKSKIFYLSITYGKTAFTIAKDWGCTQDAAQAILNYFYQMYPKVARYKKDILLKCRMNNGWLELLDGIPVYISVKNEKHEIIGGINSEDEWIRAAAERNAMNYPIQGSSQVIAKKAIVNIFNKLGYVFKIFVHDELIYELKDDPTLETEAKKIIYEMENAHKLIVPLKVNWVLSDKWIKS